MRFCRFALKSDAATPRVGIYDEAGIRDVTAATEALPTLRWPLPLGDQLIANLGTLRPEMERLSAGAAVIPHDQVRLLSPIANPPRLRHRRASNRSPALFAAAAAAMPG